MNAYFILIKSTVLQGKTTLELKNENDPSIQAEIESDCNSDRAAALEEQKAGTTALYVPECTPDGRYQQIQCYKSTGYCWCVNEDTGKNIPGTSTKDKKPQCDLIVPLSRPMKGCPEHRKKDFLKDLKQFLREQIKLAREKMPSINYRTSEDEQIATLSFVIFDKNKNSAWERKEWKSFRELILLQQ